MLYSILSLVGIFSALEPSASVYQDNMEIHQKFSYKLIDALFGSKEPLGWGEEHWGETLFWNIRGIRVIRLFLRDCLQISEAAKASGAASPFRDISDVATAHKALERALLNLWATRSLRQQDHWCVLEAAVIPEKELWITKGCGSLEVMVL